MKIFIKKVPDNEIGTGTEISILKTYFDNNLITIQDILVKIIIIFSNLVGLKIFL